MGIKDKLTEKVLSQILKHGQEHVAELEAAEAAGTLSEDQARQLNMVRRIAEDMEKNYSADETR